MTAGRGTEKTAHPIRFQIEGLAPDGKQTGCQTSCCQHQRQCQWTRSCLETDDNKGACSNQDNEAMESRRRLLKHKQVVCPERSCVLDSRRVSVGGTGVRHQRVLHGTCQLVRYQHDYEVGSYIFWAWWYFFVPYHKG